MTERTDGRALRTTRARRYQAIISRSNASPAGRRVSICAAQQLVEVVQRVLARRIQASCHVGTRREAALHVLADRDVLELHLVREVAIRLLPRQRRRALVGGVVVVE